MAGQLLVVSDGTLTAGDRLVEAVGRAGLIATLECDPMAALANLRTSPRSVVIDATMPGAEAFVAHVRSEGTLAGCAVIAIVPQANDATFSEALAWGVDEVIPASSLRALTQVAQTLRGYDPSERPPATLGRVVVAAATPAERLCRARALRNVGYEVNFAATPRDLAEQLALPGTRFSVIDAGIFPDGTQGLRAFLREGGARCPVIAIVSAHEADALSLELHGEVGARVVPRHAPPEDAIFVANELLRPALSEGRASERLLHATVASFREEGQEYAQYGITYNVSREGLYVRTLMPPPVNTDVWIELRPPTLDSLVHLEARVVWTRRFGPSAGATAPPGFGVRITGGGERSMTRWHDGYERLRRSRGGAAEA